MAGDMWNFGDLFDAVGGVLGEDQPALIHEERVISWPQMTARTNRMARALLERGAVHGDKVSFYMRNRPEYMEGFVAAAKARLTHVNINYRYLDDELIYVFNDSDSVVAFYDAAFRENVERIRPQLPKMKVWVEVGGGDDAPDFAEKYDDLVASGDTSALDIERSGDDLAFVYTGGTTGMPKGVMWPHRNFRASNLENMRRTLGQAPENMEQHLEFVEEMGRHARLLPACPLMHGTGLFTSLNVLLNGGAVVTIDNSGKFDPAELWRVVDARKVTHMAIVGDVFGKPMLEVLDKAPERFDLSSVLSILSSGVMWSMEVKQGFIKHMPQVALTDSFSASEGLGFGASTTTADATSQTAKFEIGAHCKVFSEDNREIKPGSDEPGFIALSGSIPIGYYKDEAKTAKTFKTIDGILYSVPGDWCTVAEDGTLTLLGRGSICINSGGEKIYPEEVEEALKAHEAVSDALVVGVPDDKWGQAVTGVVELSDGASADEDALRAFVRSRLAPYKAPKRVVFMEDLARAPNGKADYKGARAFALKALGMEA